MQEPDWLSLILLQNCLKSSIEMAKRPLSSDKLFNALVFDRQTATVRKRLLQELEIAVQQILITDSILAASDPGTAGISAILSFIPDDANET
jgi:hypothetical protein